MKGTEKNSVKGCKSIVTESLFGAQTIIYLSLFLIIAVDRAVKFVFAINIKKKKPLRKLQYTSARTNVTHASIVAHAA